MPEYRIYELDEHGSASEPPSIGVWKDDIEAQLKARALISQGTFEIWCGDRKVATIMPNDIVLNLASSAKDGTDCGS